MARMQRTRLSLVCWMLAALAGCSQALDWRTIALPTVALQVSLPCKPERTERSVEIAGSSLQVVMHSCKAGAATFAVACATLAQPERAGMTLTHWRAAVLAAAQAREVHDQPFLPDGALGLPQSLRSTAMGALPGGAAIRVDGAWFARVQGDAVRACHALAYGPALTAPIADVFFNGLLLQ